MSVRKTRAYTISFPVIDTTNRPARLSGVVFSAGDCQISLDGGAFSNSTNLPIEIGSTGRYALTLTAAEMDADHVHVFVERAAMDPVDYSIVTSGQPSGAVVADGSNTSSTFETDLSESTNDYWRDALLLFTTGALSGQVKRVSGYDGTTRFVTTASAFTATPSDGDRFILVNL